tara:strand:- start:1405 stop:1650 length:246 start_codon:yes stop_codon:yes gene_type:complete
MRTIIIFLGLISLVVVGWLVYVDLVDRHNRWYYEAYSLGVEKTREEYDALLKLENSPKIMEAKCMMLDYEWIQENNRRSKQ